MHSIQCLGIGNGSTNFRTGLPSSGYVIKHDSEPFLLLDCGLGIGRSLKSHVGHTSIADIFISHNHSDHTGDLPVYSVIHHVTNSAPVTVHGHPEVLQYVNDHCMHEILNTDRPAPDVIRYNPCNDANILQIDDLELELFKTKHSYRCYGFVAYLENKPVLGWSADSPFDKDLYDEISKAPTVILHARENPNHDHAGFEEIDDYCSRHPQSQYWVAHHDHSNHRFNAQNIRLLKTGIEIALV